MLCMVTPGLVKLDLTMPATIKLWLVIIKTVIRGFHLPLCQDLNLDRDAPVAFYQSCYFMIL